MDQEQPNKKPLEKIGDDFKNGLTKFQRDFNNLFKIPMKPTKSEEEKTAVLQNQNQPSSIIKEDSTESPTELEKNWEAFISKSNSDIKALEESWKQSMDQMKVRSEERQKIRKSRRENRKKKQKEDMEKIRAFFISQNKQIESTFQNMEQNIQKRKIQNRDNMYQNLENIQKKWGKAMDKQQKMIENSFSSVNSFGWKQSMKILLIIVPILVIFIIIFSMIRPFLPI